MKLFAAFALFLSSTALVNGLPTKETPKVYRFPGLKFEEANLLYGWEVQLKTDSEVAICGNPRILRDARVIVCEGIRSLEPRTDNDR